MRLLKRSNLTLFEWLQSPLTYYENKDVAHLLRELVLSFHDAYKSQWHYLSMAKKNFRGYLQGEEVRLKKYLYVLRPLLAASWLAAGKGIAPIRFADLARGMIEDPLLAEEINDLLSLKMVCPEIETGPRLPRIHTFIETMLNEFQSVSMSEKSKGDEQLLDRLLYQLVKGDVILNRS